MKQNQIEKMPIVHTRAAGIDVGSKSHYIAIGQLKEQVKEFGVYTSDLHDAAKWLVSHQITSVAMESTGSYWQQLFTILQDYGLEVILVNGRFTKNVKGKKTDVLDCQWIQKMHMLGLLEGSFLPDSRTATLRHYVRHRKNLLEDSNKYQLRMQKAMRLMNIRLDIVLNDITGKSGNAIIQSILEGGRDPVKLAALADSRVKKSQVEIQKALTGDWREEFIFELRQSYMLYHELRSKVAEVDTQIDRLLQEYTKNIDIDLTQVTFQKKK